MINNNTLFLFDIHGTLAENKEKASSEVIEMLNRIKKYAKIGFVSGSDLEAQKKQLGEDCLNLFDYAFIENGTQFYKGGKLISSLNFMDMITEEDYCELINKIQYELSQIKLPKKRGQFITLRKSTLNVSPIGRSCTVKERIDFCNYDNKHNIRRSLVEKLRNILIKFNLECAIGGQISIDIFPRGWNKTFCLRHITEEIVYFFGDKTEPGQNDHALFINDRTIGYNVKDPSDTIDKVNEILKKF